MPVVVVVTSEDAAGEQPDSDSSHISRTCKLPDVPPPRSTSPFSAFRLRPVTSSQSPIRFCPNEERERGENTKSTWPFSLFLLTLLLTSYLGNNLIRVRVITASASASTDTEKKERTTCKVIARVARVTRGTFLFLLLLHHPFWGSYLTYWGRNKLHQCPSNHDYH